MLCSDASYIPWYRVLNGLVDRFDLFFCLQYIHKWIADGSLKRGLSIYLLESKTPKEEVDIRARESRLVKVLS